MIAQIKKENNVEAYMKYNGVYQNFETDPVKIYCIKQKNIKLIEVLTFKN